MNSKEKTLTVKSMEDDAVLRKALKKKIDALRTLKSLEGKYESTEVGDEVRSKRIQAYVNLYEAEKTLEELEK